MLQLILDNQKQQGKEIGEIKQTLVTLARVEERQLSQRETLERFGRRLDNHSARIDVLEKMAGVRGAVFRWLERLALVAAGGAITKLISTWPWSNP